MEGRERERRKWGEEEKRGEEKRRERRQAKGMALRTSVHNCSSAPDPLEGLCFVHAVPQFPLPSFSEKTSLNFMEVYGASYILPHSFCIYQTEHLYYNCLFRCSSSLRV